MSVVAWYAVLGAVQVALGTWVVLANPRRVLNWAVGVLLVLWAGSGIAFQLMRQATEGPSFYLYQRVGNLYEAPTFLLVLVIIRALLVRSPGRHAWNAVFVASGAMLLAFWAVHATAAPGVERVVTMAGDELGRRTPPPLAIVNGVLGTVAQTAAVVLAARAATDAQRSVLQRRQVALIGLAFALLLGHSGAAQAAIALRGGAVLDHTFAGVVIACVGLAAAIHALARLPRAFQGPARVSIVVTILLAILVGTVSYAPLAGVFIRDGRVIVVSSFSLVLAVAALRYDLAATTAAERRRLQRAGAVLFGLCVAAVLGVAAWSLSSTGPLPLALGLGALIAPAALLATPLRRLPAWVTRRVLLHPRDSEALRERVRVYAGTLRAATGPDGRLVAGTERALAALRAELGLGQRDHDLLLALGGDQSAGGIVAYRLALVGAASEGERLGPSELERLREELNVSERDHALVLEHLEASADSLAPGALFLGRYHVVRRLGEGGLGEVWLARDMREGADVVLKHLTGHDRRDGAALQRLRREIDASVLEDPHIVQVRSVETVGDEVYLVMEHMSGGSLADVLRARGRLPEAEVVAIADDVLSALSALHANGFVHRDVKPGNILLGANGVAKLGDFNIARELVSGDTIGAEGARGPVGTFAYMPPEQARGLAARPQSDLYSLAATMREALSGEPFIDVAGLSHTEAVARITQHASAATVPNASPRLSAALARALAHSPEDRFASAAEMRAAIIPPDTRGGSGPRPRHPPA